MTEDNFWLFAVSALMLNLTPGNDMIYVMARSSSQGIKAGLISSLGIMTGCSIHVLAAAAGLSAVIARSAVAFAILRYFGGGYLVYLGVSALRRKRSLVVTGTMVKKSMTRIFWQGFLTNLFNPKVVLFFLSFLPQFVGARTGNVGWQIIFLGLWFNLGGTIVNILVALLFGKIGQWIAASGRFFQWQNRCTGVILIILGLKVALSSKK